MRHRKKIKKLGRTASHRKALLKNMASALIEHHQIRTTLAKAKAAQGYVEKLITYGKTDTVHSRRLAFRFLQNRTLVKMLFDDIATEYSDRNGGYTRVIKLGKRRGDGAEMAILQLVGFEKLVVDEGPAKKKKKRKTSKAAKASVAATAAAEIKETDEEDVVAAEETEARPEAETADSSEEASENDSTNDSDDSKSAAEDGGGEAAAAEDGKDDAEGEEEKKEEK